MKKTGLSKEKNKRWKGNETKRKGSEDGGERKENKFQHLFKRVGDDGEEGPAILMSFP